MVIFHRLDGNEVEMAPIQQSHATQGIASAQFGALCDTFVISSVSIPTDGTFLPLNRAPHAMRQNQNTNAQTFILFGSLFSMNRYRNKQRDRQSDN